MLNFNRRDRAPEPTPGKFALKPQDGGGTSTATATASTATNPAMRPPSPGTPPLREAAVATPRDMPAPSATTPPAPAAVAAPATAPAAKPAATPAPTPGSKLSIGPNIKLKGVEISDCDVLSIEGNVDATVRSTMMEIAEPGTLNGTALIDVAEIHGSFTGELTARTRLIIHGTGRVSGKIRYGRLVVEEGGELSGDVQRIDDPAAAGDMSRAPSLAAAR